ncbi:MAG: OmpA family protein [Chitinispirillaceae bacterium]|nr:OmpA family protein [Chitinispirillaceae bacterium]
MIPDSSTRVPAGFFTSGTAEFETHVLFTLDFGALRHQVPLAFHLDAGVHLAAAGNRANSLLLGGSIEIRPVKALTLFTEIGSQMSIDNVSNRFKISEDPFHISPGIIFTPSSGLTVTLGGEFSLSSTDRLFSYYKTDKTATESDSLRLTTRLEPKWRVFAQVGWGGMVADRDRDEDGVFDRRDKCLTAPEDMDGFRDMDGCPDPDNDGDGIDDSVDRCPNIPEDLDGFQDADGCPDYDTDNDRIPDSSDRCPEDAEDIDGFQDEDGCPDVDNDVDGIPDQADKCPGKFAKGSTDGCPETSSATATQRQPEMIRSKEIGRGRIILSGVSFNVGNTAIDGFSYTTLDRVVASLADWPQVQIEIVSHTDNQGDEWKNVSLSKRRAELVRDYFVLRGIAPGRLSAVGMGGSDPIADNGTKEGRAINNRVEIRRIDQQ